MNDELYYRLIPEEGKHLAHSHNVEDALRGVYLDDVTNKPCGAAELIPVNPEDLKIENHKSSNAAFIAAGFFTAGVLITAAYPHVKSFITNKIVPNSKKFWNEKIKKTSNSNTYSVENCFAEDIPPTGHSIDIALQEYREDMTSEKAKKELLEAFIFQVISARKKWRVAHANIVSQDGVITDGQLLISELTSQKLLNELLIETNLILNKNPELITTQQRSILSELLGYNIIQDGQFIPISQKTLYNGITKQD